MKCCKSAPQRFDSSFPDNGNLPCPMLATAETSVFHVLSDKPYCPVCRSPSTADENTPQSYPTPSSILHNPRILTFTSNLETLFPSPQPHLSLSRLQNHQNPPPPLTLQQQKLKVSKGRSRDIRTGRREKQIGTSVTRHLSCTAKPAGYHTNYPLSSQSSPSSSSSSS